MGNTTPIEAWQIRRLLVLADMLDAILSGCSPSFPETEQASVAGFREPIEEFRTFHSDVTYGNIEDISKQIPGWLNRLENLEADLIAYTFSTLHVDAIEIIHASCRNEGRKWGRLAGEGKGDASTDARKALLVLNDYLVDGMPTDDNIEVVSSDARQITYNLNHCPYEKRFKDAPTLAWLLCTARESWKDGFFGALGGVAHQLVSGKCQGDPTCMNIIALKDQ